ncbi:hypothetical protein PSTG_07033 [Puccinia striiformis f. sp. tritici PST-78]|uniref:HAT C-terminal dimerisation domain-containing protein n=1 Tax=Puccinia striiformis f. sp. tritici PST-78 TaxID=1165861 RepID=A0A0L0VKJ7_9BASI|nr:hypothetical protein PSTG_07033 [Puccinia striiformis f. sp. tritici PST-78]
MSRGRNRSQPKSSGASSVSSSQPPANNEPEEVELSPLTNQDELAKAKRIAANSVSESYKSYATPELSKQKDKTGRHMIAYPCLMCGTKISRPISDSSCSNLLKHASNCLRKQNATQQTQTLAALGITGTGDVDPREVPQLCAVWCAEAARPFCALADPSHKALLHPVILKNLPTRQAVSKDIHLLYSAIQDEYRTELQAHKGALYLGVDAWQSPNGFDILGVVIYRLKELEEAGEFELEAMPLDFVQLLQRHTGVYLADVVRLVVKKFGIQDRICGIVSDNASNNEVMVKDLQKLKWPRFKGETQWIRCFSHILNLIVQGILRPFGTQKKKCDQSTSIDDNDNSGEEDDPDAQIKTLSRDDDAISDHDNDSCDGDSTDQDNRDDVESLNESDIENGSDEDEGDRYTSESCKQTLAKFRRIAKKLRYSPNSKGRFIKSCKENGCKTPHSIERDVCTRWNSTNAQLKSVIRCKPAILEWQRLKSYGIDRKYHVDEADFALAQDMVDITKHLSTAITNTDYPPALRNACRVGLKITNKYYSLTDSSPLYRIAILLHPSFRDEYFKMAKWQPDWIAEAIRLAREMWVTHYKPRPIITPSATPTPAPKPSTGMLAGLSSAAAARGGNSHSDALDIWLAGGLILKGNEPVNPLKWWIQQKRAGYTHGGLVHMALDVLGCPATSVDVERSFSFGGSYVTSRRHRLAPASVSRGMTVSFYSKNNRIKPGVLAEWKEGKKLNKKMKQKNKRPLIVLDDD